MTELSPTYGNFTLRGQVVWKDRDNAYDENTSPNGFLYRRIRFGVKTADKNIVQVELFQTKFDTVKLQNKETKKLDKDVKYGEHTGELPEGYKLFMPIHLGIEKDEEGNNIKEQLIPFDAIKYIEENLENGSTVFMFGSPRFSEYEDREGNIIPQISFEPRGIFNSTVGYDDDEFEGESIFDQELILNRTEKKGDRLIVNAYIVTDKNGNFAPHTFYIDINKYQKFAMNVRKLKFGTRLKVEGIIHHTVEEKEVQQDDGWGESPSKSVTSIKRELEITKADKPTKKDIGLYAKEDFVRKPKEESKEKKEEDNPFKDDSEDDWGSSPDSDDSHDDPFADDGDDW